MTQDTRKKPTIIAVVGASASGKTLFAQTIHDELVEELGPENITIIKEDSYYRRQDHLLVARCRPVLGRRRPGAAGPPPVVAA